MKFYCQACHYYTTAKSSFDYHNTSIKHKYNSLLGDYGKLEKTNINNELKIDELTGNNNELSIQIKILTKEKIQILEKAFESSHNVLNKTLDNTKGNNTVAEKSLSVMQYLMINCMDAPDIDKLDVKKTLELSDSQYKAITYDPLNMADVILEKYYTNKTAKEISLYCADASRKKFIIKENGKWVKDPGGEKIKKYIIIPIARKTYDFNEESFNKQIKSAGGPGKLSGVQLKERKHALISCCKMEKDDAQDAIMKKLTGCNLAVLESSDHLPIIQNNTETQQDSTTSDLDCSSDDSYENDFDYSKGYNVSFTSSAASPSCHSTS
jgi:hypothetical protein